jgi:hypothetical protein
MGYKVGEARQKEKDLNREEKHRDGKRKRDREMTDKIRKVGETVDLQTVSND